MSCCTCVGAQMIGSGSLAPVHTLSVAASPGHARNGLPESHFRNCLRLEPPSPQCAMTPPFEIVETAPNRISATDKHRWTQIVQIDNPVGDSGKMHIDPCLIHGRLLSP